MRQRLDIPKAPANKAYGHPPDCECDGCLTVQANIAKGKTTKENRRQIKTYYTEDEHEALTREAQAKGISVSWLQGEIIRAHIAGR